VAEELELLSEENDFTVVGLETTIDAVGRADREELYPRLRRLLENFDHVIVQGTDGAVERVIILGEKVPFVPPPPPAASDASPSPGTAAEQVDPTAEGAEIVVATEQDGSQHTVKASLEGAGGQRVDRTLLVDTGADFVVLPASLVGALGLDPNRLTQTEMQTANGKVTGRTGIIPGVWLGEHRVGDVQAAFIEDGKLGAGGLLGMSVLGRFTMTIDDKQGQLTLTRK
jgi:clan AA aspartic protease (TIGR02281 family)